jgi:hypothetical protein
MLSGGCKQRIQSLVRSPAKSGCTKQQQRENMPSHVAREKKKISISAHGKSSHAISISARASKSLSLV